MAAATTAPPPPTANADPPIAARAVKRRRLLEGLMEGLKEGFEKFGDAVIDEIETAIPPAAGGVAPPAWAGPLLDQVNTLATILASHTTSFANLTASLTNLCNDVKNLTASLDNLTARQRNAVCFNQSDILSPVTNAAGIIPANFPLTLQALNTMDGPALDLVLGHYALPQGGEEDLRRQRLLKFIGIRI